MRFDKRWAGALIAAILSLGLISQGSDSQTLVYKKKYVMGTVFEIAAYGDSSERASAAIDRALEELACSSERIFEPEILRLHGEILLDATADPAAAEASFRRALAVAQSQGGLIWQLRAAVSLARLWSRTGRGDDARALLAPIHAAFPGGADFADLTWAERFLEGAPSPRLALAAPAGARARRAGAERQGARRCSTGNSGC